jgi:chromosome segregation ATPase
VERVVQLLKDMKSQVESEGSTEAGNYNTFACFCKDTNNKKVNSIDKGETKKASLEASLAQLKAKKAQLQADIATNQGLQASMEKALERATELRAKERGVYDETHTDTTNAVNGLKDAMKDISGSKSFLQVREKVTSLLSLAESVGLPTHTTRRATAFLQAMPEVPEKDYDFHSGGIMDMLKELGDEFNTKKSKLEQEEEAASNAFNKAADAKRSEISTTKSTIATQTTQLAECEEDIADDTHDHTETSALLADDKTYLADLTEQCERKAREWDQRSSQRGGELAAITKALDIIEGTVLAKETGSGAGGRAMMLEQGKPGKPVTGMIQTDDAADEDDDTYSDIVFVQTRHVQVHKHKSSLLRDEAITMLKKTGKKLGSHTLELAAMAMAADPFAKIKTLIQGLIERLLKEATDEATQKGWCDTELGKAESDRDYRHGDVERLSADIGVLEAKKAKLEEDQRNLKADIKELNRDHVATTKQRENEKAANKDTLENATQGLAALKSAIEVLQGFYGKASRAKTSLVQASPVDQDMGAAGTGGFAGAYKGNQAQAGGILGMLATIQSDFERSISETSAAEDGAQRDYVKFDIETKASLSAQETGLKRTNEEHQTTSTELVQALNDLKENQKLLDTSLKTLETLRPACIDTGMTWEEKVAKRTAEIEALKDALCTLDEEDKEIAECRQVLFLQK